MVFQHARKRRLQTPKSQAKARITDLPDELLLQITDMLEMPSLVNLRLTCTALAPAALTEIQSRKKILYLHPSASALRAVPGICAHPFSQGVEEVVLLGHVPLDEIDQAPESDRKENCLRGRFATWPLLFPTGKSVARMSDEDDGQRFTYDVLVEYLRKLPECKHISYQICAPEPGINRVQDSTIQTFAKKYMNAPKDETRTSDMEMLLDLVKDPSLGFNTLSIRTTLPMAPRGISTNLEKLTRLELALDLYSDPHKPYWIENHKYRMACMELLTSATNLESLKLVLEGTGKIKRVSEMLSHALELIKLTDYTWKNLKHLTLRHLQDEWHQPPQRPACQIFPDLEALKAFFQRHTSTLESVEIDNILFVEMPTTASTPPRSPPAIATMKDIIDICRRAKVPCEYTVNQFQHHQYCKRREVSHFDVSVCDCGWYTPGYVDGGTTFEGFEKLVRRVDVGAGDGLERGLSVETGEREWVFGWRDEGMGNLEKGIVGLAVKEV